MKDKILAVALQLLLFISGEYIQEAAGHVKKRSSSRDGEGHIPGTLYCTNLRVAFLPDSSPNNEVGLLIDSWPLVPIQATPKSREQQVSNKNGKVRKKDGSEVVQAWDSEVQHRMQEFLGPAQS